MRSETEIANEWLQENTNPNNVYDKRAEKFFSSLLNGTHIVIPYLVLYCSDNGDQLYGFKIYKEMLTKAKEIVNSDEFDEIIHSVMLIDLNDYTAFHINPDEARTW